ncbi:MAG: flagellar export protein FliJ [Exilibacterium sp.]
MAAFKNRSERLAVVLKLAQSEERAAGARLEQAQQQLQLQRRQLAQLKEYSLDYRRRIGEQTGEVQIQEMMTYRQFLNQLSSAEDNQEKTVLRLQQNLEQIKQLWRQKYQRIKSLETLIESAKLRENWEADKREQREMEEFRPGYRYD